MDVRMPDGTIISNVPDNITQEDLLARFGRYNALNTPNKPVTLREAATGGERPEAGAVRVDGGGDRADRDRP